jgi:hypothetical protein
VATAAVPSSHHHPTARRRPSRQLGQVGGDKRPISLGGGLQQVPRAVAVAAAVAAAEVGGPLQPVGVLLGVEAQVPGHPPQQGHGAPMQGRMHGVQGVQGVQEAVDGAQAVRHKTPAGVVPIRRRHRAAGTCDAYCERGCDLILFTMISGFHLRKAARLEPAKQNTILPTMADELDRPTICET